MTFMLPTLYNDVTVQDIFVDAVAILAVSLEIDAIYQSKLKWNYECMPNTALVWKRYIHVEHLQSAISNQLHGEGLPLVFNNEKNLKTKEKKFITIWVYTNWNIENAMGPNESTFITI